MPVITNRPNVTPPQNTGAAGATGNVQGTTPASNAAGNGTPQPGQVQSGAGQVINAQRVAVSGLGTLQMTATGTTNRFARDATFDTYSAVGDGKVARGYVKVDAEPIQGGCRVHVESFHGNHNDSVTLWLLAEVLDEKTHQLRTVTLAVLANAANLNGTSFRGNTYYDLSYADINAYLQQMNPNLKVTPGQTQLSVAARWGNGHQAGGFARGGSFRIPPEAKQQNATAVRAAAASRTGTEQADLPLDMEVAYPPQLVQQIPQLKPDGAIVSRLESELKGATTKDAMVRAVREMYRLAEKAKAGDKTDIEAIFGKDWTVETVDRYWLKDDGNSTEGKAGTGFFKGFRVDDHGLPIQDPMHDTYMDDANLSMTRHQGVIRLRKNQQATVVNVKPGGGRRDDKTQITQRIEVGVELKPDANAADASVAMRGLATNAAWSGTVFNQAQREMSQLDPTLQLAQTLVPWLDVTQDRHKFTVKNEKTGVEIELSLDFVKTRTLRPNHANPDGTPRETEFYVLEGELDHLQLQSANRGTYAANGAVNNAVFQTEQQQEQWLKATSTDVTMDIDPRLHELKDLDNASFRSTSSYKQFEQVSEKMLPHLFPKGLDSGRQKAAHAAEIMGLVCFDDRQLLAAAKKAVHEGGYAWSPAVEQAFLAAVQVPATRTRIDLQIASGGSRSVPTFIQQTIGNATPLEYDVAKAKKRVEGRLAELGYASTPEIDKMLEGLDPQKVPPANFESFLQRMQQLQDAQVMQQLAQALGVAPVPVPSPDVKKLVAASLPLMEQHLEAAACDKSSAGEVAAFLEKAAAAGATLFELRTLVQNLSNNPQVRLDQVAQQKNVPGGAPKLKASLDRVMVTVQQSLQRQYLKVDDALTRFMAKAIEGRTPQEALQFAQQLANNAQVLLDNEGKRIGVATPKLVWDMSAVEALLAPTFTNLRVLFDAPMKKLVAECLDAGVPPATLQRAFAQMQNQPLAQALHAGGVYLVGVQVPDPTYDVAGIESWLRTGLQAFTNALPSSSKALQDWVEKLLKQGHTPTQVYNFGVYQASQGMQRAAAYLGNPPPPAPPALPWDIDGLVSSWQAAFGATWSPQVETFLKDGLKKAFDTPAFVLNNVSRYAAQPKNLCNMLSQASGLPVPPGV